MKYLRLTTTPDPDAAPAVFRLIADSPHVREARLLDMNAADSRGITALAAVDGDADAVTEAIADLPGIVAADVTATGDGWFLLLATLDPESVPLAGRVFETLTRDGLVVRTPVVYRDGQVHARLVGEAAAVGDAVENLPDAVEVAVHEVGERSRHGDAADGLSDRQREAVLAAIDLGYYDSPRRATHEDVAARLDCAPSTASEHLQKAEAKLVRAGMAATAPDVPGRD